MSTAAKELRLAQHERDGALIAEQALRAEAERDNRKKDQFIARLSHELRNPLAPIVAATGWGSREDRRRALDDGFAAHLTKPVDPQELMRELQV